MLSVTNRSDISLSAVLSSSWAGAGDASSWLGKSSQGKKYNRISQQPIQTDTEDTV